MRLGLVAGILASAAIGSIAHAVVLGPVNVQSRLGQPLVAEVQLLDADTDSLKAVLASPALHQQHDVRSPQHVLGRVDVQVVRKRSGQRVLRVTSERPVREPIVEMLLQAEDRRGHIVRQMSLLLDPPVGGVDGTAPANTGPVSVTAAEPAPAPAVARKAAAKSRRATASATKKASTPKRSSAPRHDVAAAKPAKVAPVQARSTPDAATPPTASMSESVVASANPAGTAPEATATSAPAVTPPPESGRDPATESIKADTAAETPTETAATTQSPAGEAGSESAGAPDAGRTSTDVATATSEVANAAPESTPSDSQPERTGAASGTMDANATTLASRADAAPAPAASSAGTGNGYLKAGSGLALAGALLALLLYRRRQRGDAVPEPAGSERAPLTGDPMVFGTTRSGLPQPAVLGQASGARSASWRTRGNSNYFNPSALQIQEEVDPLAEADVYITYGRADHARAILEEAVHNHPERPALHLKLMSLDLNQRDAIAFKERARTLAMLTGQRGPEWHAACLMGQQLLPEDSLFHESGPADLPQADPPAHLAEPAQPAAAPAAPPTGSSPRGSGWIEFSVPTGTGSDEPKTENPHVTVPDGAPAIPASIQAGLPETPVSDEPDTENPGLSEFPPMPMPAPAAVPGSTVDLELFEPSLPAAQMPAKRLLAAEPIVSQARAAPPPAVPRPVAPTPPASILPSIDPTRFTTLPIRVTLVQQLMRAGDMDLAAAEARELAVLVAELRAQASAIVEAAAA